MKPVRVRPITLSCVVGFLYPHYKMAEGHLEFTLSVCVCVCVENGGMAYRVYPIRACVFQICVRPITSLCMVGFIKYLAQIIIKTRQFVACKNHIARSKVKVTVGT